MSLRAEPPLSLEQEPPAAAIRRFALLDSSEDEFESGGDGRPSGAATGGGNRFDSSKLEWSRLLDESSDATPSPPAKPKASLAAQLNAMTGAAQPTTNAPVAGRADAAAASSAHVSSFRRLALISSDGSADGASSGAATPPPARRVRSRPTATAARDAPPDEGKMRTIQQRAAPASLIPPLPADTASLSPHVAPPPPIEAVKDSPIATASIVAPPARPDGDAAPPPKAEARQSPPPAAALKKARTTSVRPAALRPTTAQPTAAPAEDTAPFSPGVTYTTVPQWTKGMKKRNGVYVATKTVANPTALYDRSMKGLERAAARRDALRAKLEAEERSAMPFSPIISPRANALKRSSRQGDGDAAEQESSQQLRHRLQLLELPEEAVAASSWRHSPRISSASARMVRECRERSGAATAAGERLYQDHFYRQQALEAAQEPPPSAPLMRSQRDIAAHIATLYDFEEHRRRALASAREAPLPLSPRALQPLHVDPEDVVARLAQRPGPSPRRVAQLLSVQDECTFHPQPNANAAGLARVARLRGVERWVGYFGGSSTLPVTAVLDYRGPVQREAQAIVALLSLRDPAKTEWSVEELATEMENSENALLTQLWRRRPPPGDAATISSDLTFHPTLNVASTAMVEGMEPEQRCGPTHERLFLAAKSKQLTQRQQELEEEQAALEAAQRRQAMKARQRAEWRAREHKRLEEHRAEKARQSREDRVQERLPQVPPPQSLTALPREEKEQRTPHRRKSSSSRRRQQQPSITPDRTFATCLQPSTSPLRPTRASSSSYAASVLRADVAATLASPPPRLVEAPPLTAPAAAAPVVEVKTQTNESTTASTTASAPSAAPVTHDELTAASAKRASEDLSSAAEMLRQLLGGTTRPFPTPSHCPTTATVSAAPPLPSSASTPITTRDVNRPRDGKLERRSVDVVLECATLRDPATVAQGERDDVKRAQKRQLRELGRLLYNRNKLRVEDR